MNAGAIQTLSELGHDIHVETSDLTFGFGGAQLVHRLESGAYAGGSLNSRQTGAYF